MQIVIDIPIEWLFDMKNKKFCQTDSLYQKLLNGTPLPKGHGDLVDVDILINNLNRDFLTFERELCYDVDPVHALLETFDIIKDAPTIIEADKESEV